MTDRNDTDKWVTLITPLIGGGKSAVLRASTKAKTLFWAEDTMFDTVLPFFILHAKYLEAVGVMSNSTVLLTQQVEFTIILSVLCINSST